MTKRNRRPNPKKPKKSKDPKQPTPPTPEPAPAPEPEYTCRKCGHHEASRQLRVVLVDIGWKQSQWYGVAPALMCTKCGNKTVSVEADIRDLAGLVPEQHPDAMRQVPTTIDEVDLQIAGLETLKVQLQDSERKAAGKPPSKKKAKQKAEDYDPARAKRRAKTEGKKR